jgi:CDP-diacylglycerol--glycerol-3-phosphate 3-phosphatidyltransferase
MLAGGFFDLVDGVVARHRGIATRFGAFLDSTLDRWVDAVLMVGISVHYAREGAPQHVALAGLALAAMVLVSYSKARAELVLPTFEVGLLERAERVVILAAGAIFDLLVVALWIIAIGSAITAAQRIALAYREMQRLDAADGSESRAVRAKTIELERP